MKFVDNIGAYLYTNLQDQQTNRIRMVLCRLDCCFLQNKKKKIILILSEKDKPRWTNQWSYLKAGKYIPMFKTSKARTIPFLDDFAAFDNASSGGIVPDSVLWPKSSSINVARFPSSRGIVPLKSFPPWEIWKLWD